MCLVTVCTWAKDMTVLITDSKDLPIPGLQAFISGTGSGFSPVGNLTCEQAVTLLARLYAARNYMSL